MIEKELKIRDICGYYALDIPNYNGSNFTTELLLFNSKKNAETVKHIIEVDKSKPNETTVCDMQEIKPEKGVSAGNVLGYLKYHCSKCDNYLFVNSKDELYPYCPYCCVKMDKE